MEDGSEYNVVYIKASATLSAVPMTPQILVAVVPIKLSIRRTRREPGAPPLCGDQLATLARRGFGRLSKTQHELGTNAFDTYALQVDLLRRGEAKDDFKSSCRSRPETTSTSAPTLEGSSTASRLVSA